MLKKTVDVAIVGAGIVGLATAMRLAGRRPGLRVAVVEKEATVGRHQTGHNSGVIHSGIYYRPGSLKARLCVSGARQLTAFCEEQGVPYELCGKVVVAVSGEEVPLLEELYRRGAANGVVGMRLLGADQVREIEPHVSCVLGMAVPTTGIVRFEAVAEAMARAFEAAGGSLLLGHRLLRVGDRVDGLLLETDRGDVITRGLINCAGLHSDRVARMCGLEPGCRIVPFRGEYYQIRPERAGLVRSLVYPVPDPRFPFLGVHFTRMIDGRVEAGPNAVPAYAREGYAKTAVSARDLVETLGYPGFWRLALKYWKPGFQEMARSCSRRRFARALRRLIPEIDESDLAPGGAGVRAQALSADGRLLDDFHILRHRRMVHVLNAPSPAATSSLAIAGHILEASAHLLS